MVGSWEFLPFPGDSSVIPTDLSVPKARALALALAGKQIPYARLVESRRDTQRLGVEIVIVELQVERAQRAPHDIRRVELIAIEFDRDDSAQPEVLSLRRDFPSVPHLNLRSFDHPKSLCIYERPYSEIKLRWTPRSFVEAIRNWLSKTAEGSLHQPDQALEPLLQVGAVRIILPHQLMKATANQRDLARMGRLPSKLHTTFRADTEFDPEHPTPNALIVSLIGAPHLHGVIHKVPTTIAELHELLNPIDIDVLKSLREAVRACVADSTLAAVRQTHLVILVSFPKLRKADAEPESVERWAFLSTKTVQEAAEGIGMFGKTGGQSAYLLVADTTKKGDEVPVCVAEPHFRMSQEEASRFNGIAAESRTLLMVGLGALGSQVYANLFRMGFGTWILVDSDIVLPHNMARHALANFLGNPKAESVAGLSSLILDPLVAPQAIEADILALPKPPELDKALRESEAIIDCSASQAVARHLALDLNSSQRRSSVFLNSSGTALILLCESCDRRVRLDDLEMQYYRMVLREPSLNSHLQPPTDRVRYSVGCRDLASVLPQDHVALLAAIGSRALMQALSANDATLSVWTLDGMAMEVARHTEDSEQCYAVERGGWTVRYDASLLRTMRLLRTSKLPSETGGILIGSFDTFRKIVYVVDLLPAPPDSVEQPTYFIRGFRGLRAALESVAKITQDQLEYVGEWHSHPDAASCLASSDDKELLESLSLIMAQDGLPELLVIVAKDNEAIYLRDKVRN
jgi:hypothetical protein